MVYLNKYTPIAKKISYHSEITIDSVVIAEMISDIDKLMKMLSNLSIELECSKHTKIKTMLIESHSLVASMLIPKP